MERYKIRITHHRHHSRLQRIFAVTQTSLHPSWLLAGASTVITLHRTPERRSGSDMRHVRSTINFSSMSRWNKA